MARSARGVQRRGSADYLNCGDSGVHNLWGSGHSLHVFSPSLDLDGL